MTLTRIGMLENMYEHERLGKIYLEQANFVNQLGNKDLAKFYVEEARYHAYEYVRIQTTLESHFKAFVFEVQG